MDVFHWGTFGQHAFVNTMDDDGGLRNTAWYPNITLHTPGYYGASKAIDDYIIQPTRFPEVECDTSILSSENYGLIHSPLIQPMTSRNVMEVPTTTWTRSSTTSIKAEDDVVSTRLRASPTKSSQIEDTLDVERNGNGVDVLMRAIQTKCRAHERQLQSPPSIASSRRNSDISQDSSTFDASDDRQRQVEGEYKCPIPSCHKVFTQKGRLSVHSRAHTGYKPYKCKATGCGQQFSQMGNLKTHERRHTGEKPFKCGLCNRSFAQSGNMKAHRVVHQHLKPYECMLDHCSKRFTQLGNLKSHQNKFHADMLHGLATRFVSLRDGDLVSATDKEHWEYFSSLYKHSNKGIKGRGKDRRISITGWKDEDGDLDETSVSKVSADVESQ